MRPHQYLLITTLALSAFTPACTKHSNPPPYPDLLQHKWAITSLNGEAFRYNGKPGDYFDFENGRLIKYFGGQYDTLQYTFINNNSALELRGMTGNVMEALDLHITTLTTNQLILDGSAGMPILHILDSLYR